MHVRMRRERELRNELARLKADNAVLIAERELLAPPARATAVSGWLPPQRI